MITSKKELRFYIMADYMINRGRFKYSFLQKIKEFVNPDKTMTYLRLMRKICYYKNKNILLYHLYLWKYNKIGTRLGFSIAADVFGYGLVIPHFGTIVVGDDNIIGNYAVLHTSTCITAGGKQIGNGLYLSTGAKITSCKKLGNNVSIAANSVVTKDFSQNNILLTGMPSSIKCKRVAWYSLSGRHIEKRINAIEELRRKLGIKDYTID